MANIEITTNDPNGLVICDDKYERNTLTAAGAVTWAAGTVLARNSVSGKLTAYTSGGTNGENTPIAVLVDAVTFAGAGDKTANVLVSGIVRRGALIAHSVGALTQAEVDKLRDFTILATATVQNGSYDNQ